MTEFYTETVWIKGHRVIVISPRQLICLGSVFFFTLGGYFYESCCIFFKCSCHESLINKIFQSITYLFRAIRP